MRNGTYIGLALLILWGSCNPSGNQGTGSVATAPTEGLSEDFPEESRLMDSWPREGPEMLWKYEGLGRGYGAPAVSGEGIFVNAEENGYSYTVCLDHQGELKWRSPNGKEFTGFDYSASFPGTRSAPAVNGKHVYAASGTGHLSCFDTGDGQIIWDVDLVEEYQGIPGDFGYSESPVVDKNRVYCFAGGKVNNIVAVDRFTGELVWSAPVHRDYFSYGTPILLNLPERDVLAGTSRNYIYVVDLRDGRLLSDYRLEDIKVGNEHCNSLVYNEGSLYFVPFEVHGQGTVRLNLSADGTNLTEVWRTNSVTNVFEGFIIKNNLLYTTLENRELVCLDTETGRIRHSVRAVFGNVVYADRKLFIYGHNGTLQLFSLEGGKPEFRSEMRIRDGTGQHFSFPVIAGGVMYIRRGDALMAYAIR
ncbi:MAG: outer membrane protein assembly factor BamB family protein [Bacteroidales bacterium]